MIALSTSAAAVLLAAGKGLLEAWHEPAEFSRTPQLPTICGHVRPPNTSTVNTTFVLGNCHLFVVRRPVATAEKNSGRRGLISTYQYSKQDAAGMIVM